VTRTRFRHAALLAGATLLLSPQQVFAQAAGGTGNGPAWFMPGQPSGATRSPARAATPPRAAASAPVESPAAPEQTAEQPSAPLQVQLPPPPSLPDVPRGTMPPAAVIGVLSIPDVLRASNAYREADKIIAERRQKLNEDAQKEQVSLRDMGQQLANDRAKMTADQIRAKERELQDRIGESRRKFSDRGRIIQEASQYALAQIERTLSDVVQRVAASRGMNLVLQRAEVALNQAEFDITPQVAEILNKTLPTVLIPPEGVSPAAAAPANVAAGPATASSGAGSNENVAAAPAHKPASATSHPQAQHNK
jgi:Skp family chaperone for outer membrane proteins